MIKFRSISINIRKISENLMYIVHDLRSNFIVKNVNKHIHTSYLDFRLMLANKSLWKFSHGYLLPNN